MKRDTHKTQSRAARKQELMTSTTKATLNPVEVDRALSAEEQQVLATVAAELGRLDRNTTSDAFERGRHFAAAKAIVRERDFGKWLKQHTTYTVRSAWNFISVDEKLAWHRKRCEDASIPPTSLFILAAAADEQVVEDVIASFERGERLTGARIKKMIALTRMEPTVETQPMNVGGLSGFLKAAEMRNKTDGARFDALARSVLDAVEAAAANIADGKHVTKKGLSDAIAYDARHMHDLLKTLVGPIIGSERQPYLNWAPGAIATDTAWGASQKVLERLGGADDWPGREEFPDWLIRTVLPVLRFVARGEELPGFEVRRVVEPAGPVDNAAIGHLGDGDDGTVVAIDIERQKRQPPESEAA